MNKDQVIESIREVGRGPVSRRGAMSAPAVTALEFVSLLPGTIPAPALADDDNGGICLEWRDGGGGMLSINFLVEGGAAYVVRNGAAECRGRTGDARSLAQLIREALGEDGDGAA